MEGTYTTAKLQHNIISSVFKKKQNKLMWLLKEGNIFGKLNAYIYTIEWQKRGNPYSHTLIWCEENIRPDDIDEIISAELPHPNEDPKLFHIVKTLMIHGPFGHLNHNSPFMANGKCTKRYPRRLCNDTQTGDDGYPLYRRRGPEDGGTTTGLSICQGPQIQINNEWVIPHNKMLCKIFKAYINVELCSSIKSIKYA